MIGIKKHGSRCIFCLVSVFNSCVQCQNLSKVSSTKKCKTHATDACYACIDVFMGYIKSVHFVLCKLLLGICFTGNLEGRQLNQICLLRNDYFYFLKKMFFCLEYGYIWHLGSLKFVSVVAIE